MISIIKNIFVVKFQKQNNILWVTFIPFNIFICMEEIYYQITDYPNYEVNINGGIRNKETKKTLLPILNTTGYYKVSLFKDKKSKSCSIHRIVALTLIPNPHNLKEINHIDGDKSNNSVKNLEWCSRKDNAKHSYNLGLQKAKRGKENPLHKPVEQYTLDNVFIKKWDCVMDIERELGIKNGAISNCCLGKSKKSHNFIWKYCTECN